MIFIPIGLGIVAVVFFALSRGQGKKAFDMMATETASAAELATIAADVAGEIGAGSFTRIAELKGVVESTNPLKSEMAGVSCAWYRSTVTREYEETYTERDSEGHTKTGTRRGSENVSSNERKTLFSVRDDTGSIEVDLAGAAVDGEQVLSRFEQGDRGRAISIGGFSISLGAIGPGRRTIGYRMEEWALPLGKRVYVLGEASDADGRLKMAKPSAKGGRFIVSLKSEEELTKAAKSGSTVLGVLSIVFGTGALVMLVLVLLGIV